MPSPSPSSKTRPTREDRGEIGKPGGAARAETSHAAQQNVAILTRRKRMVGMMYGIRRPSQGKNQRDQFPFYSITREGQGRTRVPLAAVLDPARWGAWTLGLAQRKALHSARCSAGPRLCASIAGAAVMFPGRFHEARRSDSGCTISPDNRKSPRLLSQKRHDAGRWMRYTLIASLPSGGFLGSIRLRYRVLPGGNRHGRRFHSNCLCRV